MQHFSEKAWYQYLTIWQRDLIDTSLKLKDCDKLAPDFQDFSFIVFPMAKAYEAFLKKFLLDLKLINKKTYEGRRFRIGRALNPDIHYNQRDQYWLYDDIVKLCGQETAKDLWETWLKCRNRVFHFFPRAKGRLSLEEAEKRLKMMDEAMSGAVQCLQKRSKKLVTE